MHLFPCFVSAHDCAKGFCLWHSAWGRIASSTLELAPDGFQRLVRFLHTADWQIGKPYARVCDPDHRARLKQVRLAVIQRIASLVKQQQLDFVLVWLVIFLIHQPLLAQMWRKPAAPSGRSRPLCS